MLSAKTTWRTFLFMLLSNTSTTAHKPQISVLLEPAVVNISYFHNVIFRISKLRSAESCPDVSQQCNDCSLCQRPLSFAYDTSRCKIHLQKPANPACVNFSCLISTRSTSNLTPDFICSLVRFPQILHLFSLTKPDRLSTVDLLTRLYRTSHKFSSG